MTEAIRIVPPIATPSPIRNPTMISGDIVPAFDSFRKRPKPDPIIAAVQEAAAEHL